MRNIRTVTADYSIDPLDEIVLVDATSAAVDIELPDHAGLLTAVAELGFARHPSSSRVLIRRVDASANAVTLNPPVGKTIDGAASLTLTDEGALVEVASDLDGNYFVVQSGGTILTGGGNSLLGEKFFIDEGIIGSMTLFKSYEGTPDAFDGTPSGSWSLLPGSAFTSGPGYAYYDLGSAKTEVLAIIGGMGVLDFSALAFSTTAPTGGSSDWLGVTHYGSGPVIQKYVSSSFTTLASPTAVDGQHAAIAFHWKAAGNIKEAFIRKSGNWYRVATESSDSTFSTIRYVGFRMNSNSGHFVSPFGCWTD